MAAIVRELSFMHPGRALLTLGLFLAGCGAGPFEAPVARLERAAPTSPRIDPLPTGSECLTAGEVCFGQMCVVKIHNGCADKMYCDADVGISCKDAPMLAAASYSSTSFDAKSDGTMTLPEGCGGSEVIATWTKRIECRANPHREVGPPPCCDCIRRESCAIVPESSPLATGNVARGDRNRSRQF